MSTVADHPPLSGRRVRVALPDSRRQRPDSGHDREVVEIPGGRSSVRDRARAYVSLTKPRIVELLLVTTVPAMLLAAGGVPSLWPGGGGAGRRLARGRRRQRAQLLHRPRHRPGDAAHVPPAAAGAHGLAPRGAGLRADARPSSSTALMAVFTNCSPPRSPSPRSSTTTSSTRCGSSARTPAEHVLGRRVRRGCRCSSAGRRSPAALAGPAWVLFAVVFLWQPPHFYALAIKFKDDYARAGIPMLPVVATHAPGRRGERGLRLADRGRLAGAVAARA